MSDEDSTVSTLSIAKILAEWGCDPFTQCVWDIDIPLTREEVGAAIMDGSYKLATLPFEDIHEYATRTYHVQRVAFFAANGWNDPIEMDFGIPAMVFRPDWPIQDGNHRFAAAIFRGDKTIVVGASGQTNWIRSFES